ncbi:MAG: replication initiator protein [Microvirus sp.]|nr:MAG: replication initiator protein [Microvirus sp.]
MGNDWTSRLLNEFDMHNRVGCFVTLTYKPSKLPSVYDDDGNFLGEGDINWRHFDLFMKRLRDKLCGRRISYYAVNEYGDKSYRPHFHVIINGFEPNDQELIYTRRGHNLYRSPMLDSLWYDEDDQESLGFVSFGSVTANSIRYVTEYVLKKVIGKDYEYRYTRVNPVTGVSFRVQRERARMSLRPAIGYSWFIKFYQSVFPKGYFTLGDNKKFAVPKYYMKLYKKMDEEAHFNFVTKRMDAAKLLSGMCNMKNREIYLARFVDRFNKEI